MAGPLAAPDEDRTPYERRGGGVGGKLRSRRSTRAAGSSALRRNTLTLTPTPTPYERPSVGRHASAGPHAAAHLSRVSASAAQGSWLGGGFVSSASRILTNGASYLFSSFFSSHRIANTSDNVANIATTGVEEELKLDIPKESNEADGLNFENEKSPGNDSDADAQEDSQFKEMENFLKQNTLTREQCNRFIDVLKAKVQDSDAADTEAEMPRSVEQSQLALARIEAVRAGSTPHPDSQRWREERQRYRQEKDVGGKSRIYEQGISNDCFLVEDGKLPSPRDIAKKYMDNRLSRASGFTLLPRSPSFKDESTPDRRSPLHLAIRNPNMQGMVDGSLPKNKLLTSEENVLQSITRSSRIPYAQLSNNIQRQDENLGTDAKPKGGSSWSPYQTPITGGREMLKRRSVVLEDVGTLAVPARRTRIRTSSVASHGFLTSGNVLGPRSSSITSEPPVAALTSSSLRRSSGLAFDREKTSSANRIMDDNWDEINGLAFIPIHSSRTAQTILETLERMSPSPKGKSLDGELALIRGRPPTRLNPSMLNKKADRTMQAIEPLGPPPDSLEATQVEDLRNVPSVEEPFAHPSNLSTQSIKVKQYLEGPRVNKIPAMSSFCNAETSEANGMELETKTPRLGVTHAPESFSSKVPDVPVSEQLKKGFRMSAYFEELLSDEEGKGRMQALISNATEKSNILIASDAITFSVSSTTTTVDNVPVSSAAPTTAGAMPTSSSTVSLSEASPNPISGFSFPLSSFTGAILDPPPTPKPMPSPLSQTDKANTISTSASLQQDTNVSSTLTAPGFPVSSNLSAGKFDSKKGSLFSTPLSISQGQFGAKPPIDSSNLNVAPASFFSQPFAKTQSASATPSSAFMSKTSASTGPSSSFVSASTFGSSFAAPSFSFGGASPSSSSVSSFEQSFSTSSSTFRSAAPSSTTTSATAIISPTSSAATARVFPSPSISSIFASSTSTPSVFTASSTLAVTSSSEKNSLASQPQAIFGRAGFGQGSNPLSQQSRSSTPVFGDSVSASFLFGNSASSSSALSTATTPSSSFGTSSFSFGSTVPTTSAIFGAAISSPFGLTNAAPVFGGSSTFSTAVSSVPAFGMESAKSFGNFGQDAGSRSLPADTSFGSFRVPTPASVGFSLTPTTSSSTLSFSFGSTAGSTSSSGFTIGSSSTATEIPYSFGAKSTSAFQQASVFGSANTMPTFGTPTISVMSNDSHEQTIMEDSMAEEITPTGPSQTSLFSTPPQAASPFTFGAPSNNASPGQGLFTFGAQPTPVPSPFGTAAQNPFAQPSQSGGLENPFAGGFTLGSGGERAGKKFIRGKRPGAKRGK